jgi:hypothetical protein
MIQKDLPMFMPHTTVDEIANLRQKITELRVREMALEKRLVSKANANTFIGLTANARIEMNVHDVFDVSKLPADILDDPKYYTARQVTSLRIEPHDDMKDVSSFADQTAPTPSAIREMVRPHIEHH